MAASGRTDDTEILFSHIDLLTSKLEILHTSTASKSAIAQQFDTAAGRQWQKAVDTFCQALVQNPKTAPHPPASNTVSNFLRTVAPDILAPLDAIKYAFQFCSMTESQLKLLLNIIKDLDIRWNSYFTTRICQLFVQYCKTVLFFKTHPICKYIATTALHITSNPLVKKFSADVNELRRMTDFVSRACSDPFELIKQNMTSDKEKEPRIALRMARLVSSIGTFIARLFGTFPLVDWEQFSIFDQQQSHGSESTLMSDEFIILSNLTMFKETLFFFMFAFPENLKANQCFELIVEAVLTETPVVSITRTVKIPLKDFLGLSKHRCAAERTLERAQFVCQQKFATSHLQRIMHITFQLQDILNICEFDPNQLPVMMNHVIALTGFAFYQLDCYFTFSIKSAEAMELLTVLVAIANLVRKSYDDLQRFYVFNLATVDMRFLREQLNPSLFEFLAKSRERNVAQLVDDLARALESLDLPEYDNGVRYDFTAFLLTHGRVLRAFNDIKNRERVSYLDPIFEHLSTIRIHAMFAQNPVEAFLTFCPIHTLWRHSGAFVDHARSPEIALDMCASLLNLFTYFSGDLRCLRQLLLETKGLEKLFPNLRQTLLTKLTDLLSSQLNSSTSQHVKIGLQTHDFGLENGFQVREFTMQHGGMTKNLASLQIKSILMANQVKRFCGRVPDQIVLFDKIDNTALFYANSITRKLASYLFPDDDRHMDEVADPASLDMSFAAATQYLWTVFAELGSSFPRQLFECRLTESIAKDELADFDQQVAMLDGSEEFTITPKARDILERQKQRLVTKLEEKFARFVLLEAPKSVYLNSLSGFWSTNEINYDVSKYFSYRGMLYLIQNLGLHAGARIDRIFVHKAAKSMKSIISEFTANRQTKAWLQDFYSRDQIPTDSVNGKPFQQAINEFITLGVCLQMRTLLRRAMSKCVGDSVPGFREAVSGAMARTKILNSAKEALMVELTLDEDDHTFIEEIISRMKDRPKLATDLGEFMFFIALLFNNSRWDDVRYIPDFDAFTDNLHLFPVAVKALVNEVGLFFDPRAITPSSINEAYKLFFATMSVIVTQRKTRALDSSARAITILADMFPRVMQIEYGRIEESFPIRFINFAYSAGVAGQVQQKK